MYVPIKFEFNNKEFHTKTIVSENNPSVYIIKIIL